jgi:hypothetical protein
MSYVSQWIIFDEQIGECRIPAKIGSLTLVQSFRMLQIVPHVFNEKGRVHIDPIPACQQPIYFIQEGQGLGFIGDLSYVVLTELRGCKNAREQR